MSKLEQILLFSYGTLRQTEVQLANYGRLLTGEPDALKGYVLVDIVIEDPHVVAISGKSSHTIARRTGRPSDRVPGVVFTITPGELEVTDQYETADYAQVRVTLESGRTAIAYVERE